MRKVRKGCLLGNIIVISFFVIGILCLAYAIDWLILVALVNLLGWFGVNGFPKPFPWWMPIALALVLMALRSVFVQSKK
jgi:amino acid transporter